MVGARPCRALLVAIALWSIALGVGFLSGTAEARVAERTGTLVVRVGGLPLGSSPAGLVRGGGEAVHLRAAKTVARLRPGTYVVDLAGARARRAQGPVEEGARLIPSASAGRVRVRVRAGRRTVAKVRYGTIVNGRVESLPASAPVSVEGDPESPTAIVLAGSVATPRGTIVSIPASPVLPRGLLARAIKTTVEGGSTRLVVEPVSPLDIVPVGEFSVPLEEADDAAHASVAGGLACGGPSGITPIRKIKDIRFDGAWNTVRVFRQDIPYGVHAEVRFTLEAGLEVTGGIGSGCTLSAMIPFDGMAGPIPVTASIGGQVDAFAGVGGKLKATGSVRVGLGVSTLGALARPTASLEDPRFHFDASKFAEANAGIGVGAKLGVGNSHVGSITARFDNDLDFTARSGSCSWDARFGQASIEGKIFGFDVETPQAPALLTRNLWHQACGGNGAGAAPGAGNGGAGGTGSTGGSPPPGPAAGAGGSGKEGESVGGPEEGPAGKTRWVAKPLAGVDAANAGTLLGVSCVTATTCWGVGVSVGQHGVQTPLAERWDGTSWSLSDLGDPSAEVLRSVSCPSPNWCAAVGESSSSLGAFSEIWDGVGWAEVAVPQPPGSQSSQLEAISCTSSSNCIAVGDYAEEGGFEQALAYRWDGTEWLDSGAVIPNPEGTSQGSNSVLLAVSCAGPTSCDAVGEFEDRPEEDDPALAESWDGEGWTMQPTPSVSDSDQTILFGVSCWSASRCRAVGHYDISGQIAPAGGALSETRDATGWYLQSVPVVADRFVGIGSVACADSDFCASTLVGSTSDYRLAIWDGSTWSQEGSEVEPDAVSCVSATYCVAVGSQSAIYDAR